MDVWPRLEHRSEKQYFDSSLSPNRSSPSPTRSKSRTKELVNLPHTSSSSLNASLSSLDSRRSRRSSRGPSSGGGSPPIPRRTSSGLGGSSCHGMPPRRSFSMCHAMPPQGSFMGGKNGNSTMDVLSRIEHRLERRSSDSSLSPNPSSPSPRSKSRRKKLLNLPHTSSSSSLNASLLSSLDSQRSRRSSRRPPSGGGLAPIPRRTSSGLEGSSRRVLPPRRKSMPPPRSLKGFNGPGSCRALSAVSYSQLTLPTIYSV